ncbi:MAG: xanthine dehydrogenase family protein molybdopterin-binding subunit [Acidimicrobiales bacterium]|nr:xanthine dehydrogenase family protein molybdopterin-binding subunit [Acidimicrobiales bacterium]MDG2218356.1 xanthine dehydrogenase family protein molybdopterin-binding subunit [Acidimicrobiales bacterium]
MSAVGTPMLRKEDPKLLTGEGKYVDDIQVTGQLWMGMVRSPYAHAKVRGIETADAAAAPGVHAVYTGADLDAMGLWIGPLPCAWPVTPDMANPPHFPVSTAEVNHVGDIVAVVLADDRYRAADAAELVVVDYDPLPAVASIDAAVADEAMAHSDLGTNKAYHWPLIPDPDALEAAFANATHHVDANFVQQRMIPSAMEPRGVLAVPSPHGGDVTLYSATQVPHILKVMLAATTGIPESKIRVIAPAVGGGFGAKLNVNPDEILAVTLANKLGRPVRWTETRSEAAFSTHQGRAQNQRIELAADGDGKLLGVRVHLDADMGAYMMLITPGVPLLGSFLYTGVYDVPAFGFTCDGWFTNLTPTDAYRGAGRPEASYAIERAMDILASKVGIGPDEIRRRNYLADGEHFENLDVPSTLTFDSGHYGPTLDRALELAGYGDLRAEQQARRDAGSSKQLGIGLCTYVEICGLAPSRALGGLGFGSGGWEHATVRMLPTGKVEVVSGSTPHGQGHETSWSQIVADKLGVAPEDVEVLHSDTAISPLGLDTYGSRSLAVGGVAIASACDKVVEKAKLMAAHSMEASADDLEFNSGMFSVAGSPDKAMAIQEVAFGAFTAHDLPDGMEPNLQEQTTWDPPNFAFPFGTHVAVVEIDEDTGNVELLNYVAVDDCGVQVNPMIVEGQVHGGIAQGVGQALWEGANYDEDGNCTNPSFMDYLVPSSMEMPNFTLDFTVTPSTSNPLGVKGVGEAGTIGSAAAVINAVCDALSPHGVTDMAMPATPQRVWRAINDAKGGAA